MCVYVRVRMYTYRYLYVYVHREVDNASEGYVSRAIDAAHEPLRSHHLKKTYYI
jgi:hypothetical protein